ncbi:flagellin [Clostridium sp.]|uniref:flagellin N-terminal helical domain-containing protein n=1 Tax=Clostridium sp. TaxID=1506 RepID=UPI0035A12C17
MIINHNLMAMNANRNININSDKASKSMQKLSSGLRINTASDDAAGLAISEKMRGQINGLDQASSNAQDSISMVQTAEGALNETTSILQRMRELAVQSSNDTATDSDREAIQAETDQLKSEIDRISTTTEFNTKKLLNGSLSAASTAKGTVAVSSQFDVADTAATAGTSKAGLAVTLSSATSGTTGTGYSTIAGDVLAERTIIQTGVNDTFDISINGVSYADVTIDASTSEGYTRQQFVEAINSAIKTTVEAVGAGGESDSQFNQVVASLTSDNHLKFTTAATGSSSTISVAIAAPTTAAANKGAVEAMGFDNKQSTVTGDLDLSSTGITVATADSMFDLYIGDDGTNGIFADVSLIADGGLTNGNTYTFSELKDALQTALNKRVGEGAVTVGDDGNGHLKLTSNIATGQFKVGAATTVANDGSANLFGTSLTASDDAHSANINTEGINTVNATTAGTYISAGANDEFNISVDGGAVETITLEAGNYATKQDLVTEINNEINDNANLVGKVTAQLDASSGKITFVSNSNGSSSSVEVTAPTATNESALGALGYTGYAGQVTGTVDLKAGVDLTGAGATKLSVTLGNKTVNIDLAGNDGINTDATLTTKVSSRDAIVNALQSELDQAFGEGAVTVNTSTTAAGVDTLIINNNTRGAVFSIADGAGKDALFVNDANAVTASVSAAGVNVETSGTDAVDNALSNSTLVTNLSDKDGNNLGLKAGNVIKITGTQNGEGFETSLTVTDTTTLSDIQNSLRNLSTFSGATVSLDATTGKLTISGASGSTKDISNLAFTAQESGTDTTAIGGFNKQFSTFNVTQEASDTRSDNSIITQIGANQGQTMNIDINDMGSEALKVADIDVTTQEGAETAITVVDNAIQKVSAERAKLGAVQNRLEHTINNLGTSSENLSSAESRIRDVDMASEMAEYSKNNVLSQAAQAMLAQANQQPQQVLQLLR